MNDDIMAGSRTAHVLADEWDAESLRLLVRHIGPESARLALGDEAYLPVVLPVLQSEGGDEGAVSILKATFADEAKPPAFREPSAV